MGVLSSPQPPYRTRDEDKSERLLQIDRMGPMQLREQARRCRRLARSLGDIWTITVLETMAGEYEDRPLALEGGESPGAPSN